MAFKEKTAWVMLAALLLGGLFYGRVVMSGSAVLGETMPPLLPIFIIYTLILILVSVAGHIIAALGSPHDANAPTDEREAIILARSGSFSHHIFAAGALLSLGHYLIYFDGNFLFHSVFASLMLAQATAYAVQIFCFRQQV